jgi:ubiquinone/menaquinone biosynthesis C-methylase UbiE
MHNERKEGIMRQQDPTPASNPAETYEQYFVPTLFRPWSHVLLQHAALQSGERVLDVACGTGIVARQVAPAVGAGGKVVGLDINPAMLAVARSQPPPEGATIEWHEASALALPFPSAVFDLVLCQQGLQFFSDKLSALREMRRVLAPHGRAVLSVWQSLAHNPVYQALDEAVERHLGTPAFTTPFSLGDADEVRQLLSQAGFQHVAMAAVERMVRFPASKDFVQLAVLAAAAVIPAFAQLDAAARAALVAAVKQDVDATLQRYTEGDTLVFPMAAYIAKAQV